MIGTIFSIEADLGIGSEERRAMKQRPQEGAVWLQRLKGKSLVKIASRPRNKSLFFLQVPEGHGPADTLTSDSGHQNCEPISFFSCKPPTRWCFVTLLKQLQSPFQGCSPVSTFHFLMLVHLPEWTWWPADLSLLVVVWGWWEPEVTQQ